MSRKRTKRTLSPKQNIVMGLLLAGSTAAAAAAKVKVRRQTISRWLNHDELFRETFAAEQKRILDEQHRLIVTARATAWECVISAGDSIKRRLDSGELIPTPRDAKALVDAAITLRAIPQPEEFAEERSPAPTIRELLKQAAADHAGIMGLDYSAAG